MRYLAAIGAVLTLTASPALAGEQPAPSSTPVTLSDQELDQVTAGDGSLLDLDLDVDVLLNDITVAVNISNVPINAGVALQVNALGTAAQTSTIQALQEVTQIQTVTGF
jgi:hypothetical protein